MEQCVKQQLQRRKLYEAESRMLSACIEGITITSDNDKIRRKQYLDMWIEVIDGWLFLLSADEIFVVKRHLFDGIDWPRVTLEYEKIWGVEYAKAERTLRNYQKRAIGKIAAFLRDHNELIDPSS